MASAVSVARTNNPEIDGLLGGSRWSGTVTYSFPDSTSDYPASYYGGNEPTTAGFATAPVAMQTATNYAVALISSYTNISMQFAGSNGSDIAIAQSPAANPTSYAYYPANVAAGGDMWFGTAYNYSQARLGNYYFSTALHELGHSLGLKHGQETGGVAGVAVPSAHDNSEYTVMSYRSYAGAPLTGYPAEAYGYAQTYMANDILALQTLYGANFATHTENTVYSWSPTTGQQFINGVAQLAPGSGNGGSSNRIFETVWDGNGIDTYDFSNYTTALRVNLNPGASSTSSATQIANLGNGHYAAGNIYNAYLFNGDVRSYIDNAIGGSGNDSITGNAIANALNGGSGNDTLIGGAGNDSLMGGAGTDIALFGGNRADYLIGYSAVTQTVTVADQRAGSPEGTDTVTGVESFQFADGAFASSAFVGVNHAPVLTVSPEPTVNAGQVLQASSLFSAIDADHDPLAYYLYDNTAAASSGYFLVNGMVVAAGTPYAVSEAQLTQTTFVVGAAGTSDGLYVQASDGLLTSNWIELHVNVVNRAPTGESLSGGVIAENSPSGTVVGTVSGSDPDIGTVLHYSLTGDANSNFAIDSTSGRLTVIDGSRLDYEAASSCGIVVRAIDQGGLFYDQAFTIQLTDLPGVILSADGGSNTLVGTSESDTLNGLGGNDVLTGGGGNDTIDGGAGTDTAVYSGNRVNYQIAYTAAQTFTILDQRQGTLDGADSVTHVEQLQFADELSSYSFDAGGALISEPFNSSSGTHWINAFDTTGNQTWVWSIGIYGTDGALRSESGLNHNGTHFLTLHDLDNQYSWANATISFDAAWNPTSVNGTRDDGSHSVIMNDIAAAYDLTTWYATPFTNVMASASPTAAGHGGNGTSVADTANATFFLGNQNDTFVFSVQDPQPTEVGIHRGAVTNNGDLAELVRDQLKMMSGLTDLFQSYKTDADTMVHSDTATGADLYGAQGHKFGAEHFLL